jgi:hypothetical protein
MVVIRLLPPILPPLRPIAAMMRDMASDTFGGRASRSSVPVERRTIWKAAWFMSVGCLLKRFGMVSVCHGKLILDYENSK